MNEIQVRRDTRWRCAAVIDRDAYKVFVDNKHWGWTLRITGARARSSDGWVIWDLEGNVVISIAESNRLGNSFDDAAYLLRKKLNS